MFALFLLIPLVLAALNWWSVKKDQKILEYITKPAVMLTLIAWMLLVVGVQGPLVLFTLGLCASLIGDVLLMLPREQFVGGLVAFLVAHVCYIVGFNFQSPPLNFETYLMLGGVVLIAWRVIGPLQAGLLAKGYTSLLWPVRIYAGVISLMLLSALVTLVRPEWGGLAAVLVSLGAMAFFLSDTLLAWNRFVTPVEGARVKVLVTYHLGQLLIALGAALQFMQ